ncbi:hypothetical protein FG05_35253 [Fusarium graminearum]|nr:hypothetical protein FG05_35253 [Fusarium graminearum]
MELSRTRSESVHHRGSEP